MLTIVCWQWQSNGWRGPYTQAHVNALRNMLDQNVKIPHRLICVTDTPQKKGYNCEVYPLWKEKKLTVRTAHGKPNCYQRLKMFDPKLPDVFGDHFLSIDLDVVILSDITDMVDVKEDFKIIKGVAAPYNGSMWYVKRGARAQVFNDFDPIKSPIVAAAQKNHKGKPYYGSDQAWLSYKLPGEATWSIGNSGYYPYSSHVREKPVPDNASIVFFAGQIKPWHVEVKRTAPECYQVYQQYLRG